MQKKIKKKLISILKYIIISLLKFNWIKNIFLNAISNEQIINIYFNFSAKEFMHWILTSESLKEMKFEKPEYKIYYTLYYAIGTGFNLYNFVKIIEMIQNAQNILEKKVK